jgi:hypothetical protein
MNLFQARRKQTRDVNFPKCMRLVVVILGTLFISLPAFAQGSFGTILGAVTDSSGGVIAAASVTVLNTQTGVSRTLTTNSAGQYNAPTLNPGTYTVRAEANGFKAIERQNVVLEVGQEVRVDLTLQPGSGVQTVTVTAATPLVNTASPTLGGTLESSEIANLPLNGRNYQYLMNLRPGVVLQPGAGPWTSSTNGDRPDTAAIMVDGVINFSWYDSRSIANDSSAFTDAANILPIDAIQEFNIEENPKAEYGWRAGAVMNVGIKSGTNAVHGTGFAFGRNGSWDARDAFNPGLSPDGTCIQNPQAPFVCNQNPTQLEQFGGTVGGPIKKDKLFYFAGYEGLRDTVGSPFAVQVPQTASAGGNPAISEVDAITALQGAGFTQLCSNSLTTGCLSPVSLDLLGCSGTAAALGSYACTGGLIANDPANKTLYESSFPISNSSDNGIVKINYNINSKNIISGMFWTGRYAATGQDKAQMNSLYLTNMSIVGYSDVEDWIYTPNSSWVNDFRFGYDRAVYVQNIGDAGIIPNGKGGLCTATGCGNGAYPLDTGVTRGGGLPPITIAGFGGNGDVLGQSNSGRPSTEGPHWYYDFQDNASYLRGKHAFKFGGEFIITEAQQNVDNFRGNLVLFSGGQTPGITDCGGASCALEDFFAGNPSMGSVNVGNPLRQMRWNQFALYVQDDWRIKPRLTLNLGLRYEYSQPIREVNNLYGSFDPNSTYGIVQQGQPGVGNTLWKPNRKNFAPRLGFAWDTNGKGTTVLRGGVSIMYSEPVARYFMDNAPPNGSLGNISQDPTGACSVFFTAPQTCASAGGHTFGGPINFGAPTLLPSVLNWNGVLFPQGGLACTTTSQCSLYAVSPNLQTPYLVNYNVDVQHLITNNLSLEVGYVGNHGYNLLSPYDANQCAPNPNGNCVRPYGAQFPYLGIITVMDNYGYSNYNSLQATLTQRTSHGLDFIAGYTYGHALDDGSLNLNEVPPQNSLNRAAEYASSDFDVRHRFTLALNYAIPGKKGYGQLLEGWHLNTILTLQSAQPWLVFDRFDSFSTAGNSLGDLSDRWDFFGNTADFKSGGWKSIMHCSGPGDGQCSQTSGITGQLFCGNSIGTSTANPGACDAATSASLWAQCTAVAPDPGTLGKAGCYVAGKSVMVPPLNGTYGTMGRNIFRDTGFADMDFSVFKDFTFKERYGAEFRVEVFNVLNHPNYANPYGSSNTYFGGSDPSSPGSFGCGCSTPDVAAGNPVIGSGSNRVMQLGLKLTF